MKWTYHISHSLINSAGDKVTFMSQLYQVEVYAIINGDPGLQCNLTPANIEKTEKHLRKLEKQGNITELQFGEEITVSDATGFFEKVET